MRGLSLVVIAICFAFSQGVPTNAPSVSPTLSPTDSPTLSPTGSPTLSPTPPTPAPTLSPTGSPTLSPTGAPTKDESVIGKTNVKLNVKAPTARKQSTQQLITDTRSSYTGAAEELSFTVDAKEVISLNDELLAQIGNDEDLLKSSIATSRGCGVGECTVTIGTPVQRRALQQNTFIVTIEYLLSETGYNALEASGATFDDPAFLTDLATQLGVHADNITVTSESGEIDIEVTLTLANDPNDPHDEGTLQILQTIKQNMDSTAQTVITNFGGPGDSFQSTTLDLCGTNTCNGRGTCDPNTGVCNCTSPYVGLSCAAQCSCDNGGYCSSDNENYVNDVCVCAYPYHGKRCELTMTCNECA